MDATGVRSPTATARCVLWWMVPTRSRKSSWRKRSSEGRAEAVHRLGRRGRDAGGRALIGEADGGPREDLRRPRGEDDDVAADAADHVVTAATVGTGALAGEIDALLPCGAGGAGDEAPSAMRRVEARVDAHPVALAEGGGGVTPADPALAVSEAQLAASRSASRGCGCSHGRHGRLLGEDERWVNRVRRGHRRRRRRHDEKAGAPGAL